MPKFTLYVIAKECLISGYREIVFDSLSKRQDALEETAERKNRQAKKHDEEFRYIVIKLIEEEI